jgi:hypothetical protein
VNECKVEVGQIWTSKKTEDPWDATLTIKIIEMKGEFLKYVFVRDDGSFLESFSSMEKDSLCRIFELKDSETLTFIIPDQVTTITTYPKDVIITFPNPDPHPEALIWHDGTKNIEIQGSFTTDTSLNIVGDRIYLGQSNSKKTSCIDGEIWYDGSSYYGCVNNISEEFQFISQFKRKEKDMFTFGNLCILIVLMFVVAKIAAKVDWYVFLYPIKKMFGFGKRTAKKVEEELKVAKDEWNKIEE